MEEDITGLCEDSSDPGTSASSVDSAACVEHEEPFAPNFANELLEVSDDEDHAQAPRRALVGARVVEANNFCTLVSDPNYLAVKMILRNRWCTPEHCGAAE